MRGVRRDECGYVLITVLGTLLILTLVASALMVSLRNQGRLRAVLDAEAQLQVRADGAARLAALEVAGRRVRESGRALTADGVPVTCRDGDFAVETRIVDANGLIELNAAPTAVLEILMKGLGATPAAAAELAGAIEKFRQPLTGKFDRTGSDAFKQAAFDVVDELDQIPGMTPDLFVRLRPLVTVYTRSPWLDTAVAPLELLEALTRGQFGAGAKFASREQFQAPPQLPVRPATRATSSGRNRLAVFHIQSVVADDQGRRAVRRAVVELVTRTDTGFIVREWTAGLPGATSAALHAPPALLPCM